MIVETKSSNSNTVQSASSHLVSSMIENIRKPALSVDDRSNNSQASLKSNNNT